MQNTRTHQFLLHAICVWISTHFAFLKAQILHVKQLCLMPPQLVFYISHASQRSRSVYQPYKDVQQVGAAIVLQDMRTAGGWRVLRTWKTPSSSHGICHVMSSHKMTPKEKTSAAFEYACSIVSNSEWTYTPGQQLANENVRMV